MTGNSWEHSTCWLYLGGIEPVGSRKRDRESGSVLLWVMVVGLFTVGALGAATRLIPAGTQFSVQDSDTTYAFIAAESGVNYIVHHLKKNGLGSLEDGWSTARDLGDTFDGTYSVVSDGEYIYVTGEFGGAKRTLRAKALTQGRKPKIDMDVAIFALAGPDAAYPAISVSGGPQINGDIGTNAVAPGSVRIDWNPTFNGDVIVGPGAPQSVLWKPEWMNLAASVIPMEVRDYPVPIFPEPDGGLPARGSIQTTSGRPHVVIDAPGRYDTISAHNGTIEFATGGGDLHVRTKTLELKGGPGAVTVTGGGRLFLYVDQTLRLEGRVEFNVDGDPMAAVIYYAGKTALDITGPDPEFQGILYVKDAGVTIGSSFRGQVWVFSGGREVTLNGNAKLGARGIVYAPKAHVLVTGSAGTSVVIGNSVVLNGGSVVHQPLSFDRLPLDFASDPTKGVVESLQWQLCWTDCLTVD